MESVVRNCVDKTNCLSRICILDEYAFIGNGIHIKCPLYEMKYILQNFMMKNINEFKNYPILQEILKISGTLFLIY